MPKRTDIKKVLVIGSGPIVIGQAAEFDYAGTQACLALKEEGYEVVLCNSNPATIMTDTSIADKVYMEPLTLEYIAKIIRYERPDAILPSIGGQTGLNLAMQLEQKASCGSAARNCLERKAPVSRRQRTVSSSSSSVRLWVSRFCHRILPTRLRKAWRSQQRSAIPWCCALPLLWEEQAAALPIMKQNFVRS